jgi:hypothetical protein
MEWIDCPHCIYRHPFHITADKPCPNVSISEAKCQAIFNKPLVLVLRQPALHVALQEPAALQSALHDAQPALQDDERKRAQTRERVRRLRERLKAIVKD